MSNYLLSHKINGAVAVCLDRSIELIISILAIAKCNCIYVPLDPNYPIQRISYLLDDSGACILLANSLNSNRFSEYSGKVFVWMI